LGVQVQYGSRTNSTAALSVNNAAGTSLLQVDTTNDRVVIGNTTADAVGTTLVLDTKTTSADPAGVNGAMYYNSALGNFRCYENNVWRNCIGGVGEQDEWSVRATSGSFRGVGVVDPTTSGTLTSNNQSAYTYTQAVTPATTATRAGYISSSFDITRRGYSTSCTIHARAPATLPTNARVYIGLVSATPIDANDHGGNLIGFRYSTVAGDTGASTGWRAVTRNGTTNTVGAANISSSTNLAVDTDYILKFRIDSAANTVYFLVNGSTEEAVATTIPAAATNLGFAAQIMTSDATADSFNFGRFSCEQS
jgi:hypothetical protein